MRRLAVILGTLAAMICYWFATILAGQLIINRSYFCHSEMMEPAWSKCHQSRFNVGLVLFSIAQIFYTFGIWKLAPYFKEEG